MSIYSQTKPIYYVYAYISKRTNKPYYIGKGKDNRAYGKHHKGISVPKDKNRIVFLETNLTELGAFALERRYIKWYGKRLDKTGCLLNITDGGEGSSGRPMLESTKEKLLKANLGRKLSDETKEKMSQTRKGRTLSEEHKNKIADAHKGKKKSKEHIEKRSAARNKCMWITDGKSNKLINKSDPIPKGFYKGMTFSTKPGNAKGHKMSGQAKEKMSQTGKGMFYVTNGTVNKKLKKDSKIPEGFRKGRI